MALVLPGVLFLAMGGSGLILLLYAVVSLHSADEAGARYASMYTADNSGAAPPTTGSTSPSAYATNVYKGPGLGSLTFVYSTTGSCGGNNNLVTGTGTYHLYYGVGRLSISLSDHSCFP